MLELWDDTDQNIVFQVAVHVVWVHFHFNGFPDESVHISSFSRKKFCIL